MLLIFMMKTMEILANHIILPHGLRIQTLNTNNYIKPNLVIIRQVIA